MRKKPHICGNSQMEYKVRKYPGDYQISFLADDRCMDKGKIYLS